ncbi:MAG: UbiA family prenyltransferase [Candidatus Odinarchaeota archaeon]|nr:UbiA family prenyltransferase [Candidatus Odinarchaeota archaeon]
MEKLKAYISIIRPINCLMMCIANFVGEFISIGFAIPLYETLLASISVFLIVASAMVLNDYVDLPADRINAPERPLPSGKMTQKEAIILFSVLSFFGILTSYFINLKTFLMASFYWFLAVAYDTKLKSKGLLGNFVVSLSVAAPFVYGGFVVSSEVSPLLFIFSTLAFLANTGREITKGIVDIEGDKMKGYRTLAVVKGPRLSAIVASVFYLSAVVLSPLPYLLGLANFYYLIMVSFADIIFVYLSLALLKDFSGKNARYVKNRILIAMFVSLVAFLMISIR